MSTFLQLAQKLRREVGIAGVGPDAVTNQIGQLLDVVEWTRDSWVDIQNLNQGEWQWLRRTFTLQTTINVDTYEFGDATDDDATGPITRFKRWRFEDYEDPPKIYPTAGGIRAQRWLIYLPWAHFKLIYKIGSNNLNSGPPAHITVDPQKKLVIGPQPNAIYTLTGDFYRSAQRLDADGDVPECDEDFHDGIVYFAMQKYGYKKLAPYQVTRGANEWMRVKRGLEADQLPGMTLAGPMV